MANEAAERPLYPWVPKISLPSMPLYAMLLCVYLKLRTSYDLAYVAVIYSVPMLIYILNL